MRQGYYWTTTEADCAAHVQKCHQCQVHRDLKYMPPMALHTMTSLWPFFTWGIDIIRKIHTTTSNGHEYILVAIDYFTKWVEATSYKVLNSKKFTNLFKLISFVDMGYLMKLSLTMGYISREKQRSCCGSSIFGTTIPHPIVLRLIG